MFRRFLRAAAALLVLAVVALVAAAFWFRNEVGHERSLPTSEVTLVVPPGATGHDVARLLGARRIVRSPLAFDVLARLKGEQSAMKAGEFRFPPHRTTSEVLQQIVEGGQQIAQWVTIPEGFTAKQIGRTLAARSLGTATRFDDLFFHQTLDLYGERTATLEGYLFPDSYLMPMDASPKAIVKIMTDQFRAQLPKDAPARARRLGFSIPQIVTLASLVEREAKSDDERALMAGVYYNRLRRGMPLEVDATIEYTFAQHKDVITYADLARDSPYNTYKHTGLPPTPIANPGRPSLDAAFFPRASDYLYYVYAGNGHSAFARTLSEHNANVARYLH